MTTKFVQSIEDDFLSNSDRQYLIDLVTDWLSENARDPDMIEFSIRVHWSEITP